MTSTLDTDVYVPALLPVCGAATNLPDRLRPVALAFAPPGTVEDIDIESDLRCTLQAHISGEHYAFALSLPGSRTESVSVWARWNSDDVPALTVLPDCVAALDDDEEVCCAPVDHPGAHSYELTDPWRPRARTHA